MSRSLLILPFVAIAALWIAVAAASTDREAALRGIEFIRTTQQDDGGFGGFGPGQTYDAVYAIRSVGIDPTTVTSGGNSPADFLRANLDEATTSAASAAKAALAAHAMNIDPTDVDGTDLIAAIEGFQNDSGAYGEDAFSHGTAMLGLVCTGNSAPDNAVDYLRESQLDDGGWGFEDTGDLDTTAIVVQALIGAGVAPTDPAVADAVAFLQDAQNDDRGWGFEPGESNANSTAYVIQALTAAGKDIAAEPYAADGANPLTLLVSLQQDDGSFPGFDPAYAANQAVPALNGKTFCDAVNADIEQQDDSEPTPAAIETAEPGAPVVGSAEASSNSASVLLILVGLALISGGSGLFVATRRL